MTDWMNFLLVSFFDPGLPIPSALCDARTRLRLDDLEDRDDLEDLEDLDDVQKVYSNFDVQEEELEKLLA